ncbi:MAG: hypothetical protein H7Y09_04030 [Chitinophagaceae bacterium]|nr:hypothetical protein [Anaerolineae bacterium]
MYVRERLAATIFIWLMLAGGVTVLIGNSFMMSDDSVRILAMMFAVFGVITAAATRFIWNGTLGLNSIDQAQAEKSKRSADTRVSKLLASLTDDELDDLRQRLSAQDGELVSLNDLLQERNRRSS